MVLLSVLHGVARCCTVSLVTAGRDQTPYHHLCRDDVSHPTATADHAGSAVARRIDAGGTQSATQHNVVNASEDFHGLLGDDFVDDAKRPELGPLGVAGGREDVMGTRLRSQRDIRPGGVRLGGGM